MLSEGSKEQLLLGCPSSGQWELSHLPHSVTRRGERWADSEARAPAQPCLVAQWCYRATAMAWASFSLLVKYGWKKQKLKRVKCGWYCEEAVRLKWFPHSPLGCIKLLWEKLMIHPKKSQTAALLPHRAVSQRPRQSLHGTLGSGTVPGFYCHLFLQFHTKCHYCAFFCCGGLTLNINI